MSRFTPTDDLDRAFRQAYQVIVDQTELPGAAVPVFPLSRRPRPRARGPLVAVVGAAVVLTVGGLAFLTGKPYDFTGHVERLALVEPPPALGGEPVVQTAFAQDGEEPLPAVSGVDMWIWAADDGAGSSVALFESDIDADMTALLGAAEEGQPLTAPVSGETVEVILPDNGWYATSWTASGRWRIAVGFDDAEVREMARTIDGYSPSMVELNDRHLVYEGPQILHVEGEKASGISYESPAGGFGVILLDGRPHLFTTLTPLLFPALTDVVVNGMAAVTGSVGEHTWEGEPLPDRAILWQVGDEATAFVGGVGLSLDLLLQVAEEVRPVTLEQWQAIADTAVNPVD